MRLLVSLSLVASFLHSIAKLQCSILIALPKSFYNATIMMLGANGSSESDVGYSFVHKLIEAHKHGMNVFQFVLHRRDE